MFASINLQENGDKKELKDFADNFCMKSQDRLKIDKKIEFPLCKCKIS